MLQQLIDLVKENAGPAIFDNPAIPADKKEEAAEIAGKSIAGGLQNVLSGGGVREVMSMFGGKSPDLAANPITEQISGSFIHEMTSKLGLSAPQAGGIASSLIPMILGKLINKTNDPSDSSFDIQDIFNKLSDGKTSGMNMGSIFNKLKGGLDQDGDGDTDLDDLKNMFGGTSGSLLDKLKGAF